MNTQQYHPLLQPATSETVPRQRVSRFRLWGRIVALSMVLLVCSCATLTPDRIAVLAALAGNAAQIGVQEWLKLHPEHRESFEAVARAIAAFLAAQGTPPDARESTVALVLRGLPKGVKLQSKESELYISGTLKGVEPEVEHLVIYDAKLGKSYRVDGKSTEPVLRAIRNGMLRALAPVPPLPPAPPLAVRVRTHRNYQSATNTITISNSLYTHNPAFAREMAPPLPVVESPTPIPAGKSSPRRGNFVFERKDGTNWVMLGVTNGPVAEWRVRRVR